MRTFALLSFIVYIHVHTAVVLQTHVHTHHFGQPLPKSPHKRNKGTSEVPSAGDNVLNPWLYRFPPWYEPHNPAPPSLALTNGDAVNSPNHRFSSKLPKVQLQGKVVFRDITIDTEAPFSNEVLKTVINRQQLNNRPANDVPKFSTLLEESNHLTGAENDKLLIHISPKENVKRNIDFRSSARKTGRSDAVTNVYSRSLIGTVIPTEHEPLTPKLFPKTHPNMLTHSSLLSDQLYISHSSTEVAFPDARKEMASRELTKLFPNFRNQELTPRGLNPELWKEKPAAIIHPSSIQDIISRQAARDRTKVSFDESDLPRTHPSGRRRNQNADWTWPVR